MQNCPHGRPTIRHLLNLAMLNINEHPNDSIQDENTSTNTQE